jgi:hypothetical protein
MATTADPVDNSSNSLEKNKEALPSDSATNDLENPGPKTQDPLALLELIRSNDDAHPQTWRPWKKWLIVATYCTLQIFVTLTSTTYVSVEYLIMEKWTSNAQVATLGQSMFIVGTAVGPAFLGTNTARAGVNQASGNLLCLRASSLYAG